MQGIIGIGHAFTGQLLKPKNPKISQRIDVLEKEKVRFFFNHNLGTH